MRKLVLVGFVGLFLTAFIQPSNVPQAKSSVLKKVYDRYHGRWYRDMSFSQSTEFYRADSLAGKAIWHEQIIFPFQFRISIGDVSDGNAMIQLKDSLYIFRAGKLRQKAPRGEDVTFVLGGMFFVPFDSVVSRLTRDSFDLSQTCVTSFQGHKVLVIGASDTAQRKNQLWFEEDRLLLLRELQFTHHEKEDAVFTGWQPFGRAFAETACDFSVGGHLIQREKYFDCKVNTGVDPKWFDPEHFFYK